MYKLIFVACSSFLALSGCASNTGVVPLGKGSYMLAKQAATGFPGLGNLKAEAIAEGAAKCVSMDQRFELISSTETQPPYILGNYPRVEIHFVCKSDGAVPTKPQQTDDRSGKKNI